MRGKLSLNLDDLTVDSFDTTRPEKAKGTVFGEQCTCYTQCTCPGCPTCYESCNGTCGDTCYYTCDDASCAGTCASCGASCNGTCAGYTCRAGCGYTALETNCNMVCL
jgi:hypothetical protein